ncbi:5-(carboxyamino)imidazole ribonucleotide mutase [Poriferisphaera sp. WC338]|uniref:5-(carboxyamino)imidazole ribonucleotide mutase n=1 Tax=Poriferisphaera sp. WC338 TaxID=3425129 RepID=UPI003D81507C
MANQNPLRVGIVMGSASDGPTMKKCAAVLDELGIGYDMMVCSAHRTPDRAHDFATNAAGRGIKVIIAAAGMSAHLAGVMASLTHLPILGVPMDGKLMGGLDALLSTCNMPKGIPVGTMSMGSHGAVNAALFAAAIIATSEPEVNEKLIAYRKAQTAAIPERLPEDD